MIGEFSDGLFGSFANTEDVKYIDGFVKLQKQARDAKKGLWAEK